MIIRVKLYLIRLEINIQNISNTTYNSYMKYIMSQKSDTKILTKKAGKGKSSDSKLLIV